jgi:hypothetical protein
MIELGEVLEELFRRVCFCILGSDGLDQFLRESFVVPVFCLLFFWS